MQLPQTLRHVQRFTGSLAALSRFISKLGEKVLSFYQLLRKTDKFIWTAKAQAAFDDLKRRLSMFLYFLVTYTLCLAEEVDNA
jgi:hypothetical protein